MLLESFFVYTLFAFAMYACALSEFHPKSNLIALEVRGAFPKGYMICIALFFLIAGLRYNVGVDYMSYLESYKQALDGHFYIRSRGYEESYVLMTTLFGNLGIHPVIYFGLIASVQLFLVMYTYKEERSIMPFMMLLLILGDTFFVWMNGIRQSIAACIFVFSIKYIREKKLFLYLLCMLFALSWHSSSVILIPFYFLAYDKHIWDNKWFLVLGAVICLILGNTPIWVENLSQYGYILSSVGYDFYSDKLDELVDSFNFTSFSLGPRLLFIYITYFIIVIFYPKARQMFPDTNIDITFKICYIGICAYFLFYNTNMILLRPIIYFTIFTLPMIAYLMVYLKHSRYKLLFYVLLLTSLSNTYLSCMSDASVAKEDRKAYLYHFYFQKDVL